MNLLTPFFRATYPYILLLTASMLCLGIAEVKGKESLSASEARCERILEILWEKQGGQAKPGISIEPISEFGKPAEYDFKQRKIIIDPRAYKLCLEVSNQKDDALAFLIAHELVHAYQHRSFSYVSPGFFVKSTSLKNWAASQKARRKQMESKADIWGAVLCYLAGYKVENNIPLFIEELYDAFDLNEEDPLYDSKKERLAIANRAKKEVHKAIQVYDMAVYLSVLQAHDKDTVLYQYLIDDFKSAEFYNNLGLAYTKMALSSLKEPYKSYPYPFVLDTETRLEKVPSKGRLTPHKLLLKGISSYNEAIRLNPDYLANRINRACAFHMLSADAGGNKAYFLEQARKDLAYVQRYNEKVYAGPASEIRTLHARAQDLLKIINTPQNSSPATYRAEIPIPTCSLVSMDQLDISNSSNLARITYDWKLSVSFEKGIEFSSKKLPHSQLFSFIDKMQGEGFFLQKITKRVANAPRNIFQVGSMIPAAAQSRMRKSVSILQGDRFFIQDQLGVVYKVGIDNRVIEWAIYREI